MPGSPSGEGTSFISSPKKCSIHFPGTMNKKKIQRRENASNKANSGVPGRGRAKMMRPSDYRKSQMEPDIPFAALEYLALFEKKCDERDELMQRVKGLQEQLSVLHARLYSIGYTIEADPDDPDDPKKLCLEKII